MKRIEIGVGTLKGGLQEFARVWRRAAAGERLPYDELRITAPLPGNGRKAA